jgi:large subunit ribosomal protein L10
MDNPRPEKVAVVEEVRDRLGSSSAAILTEYRGLSVPDMAVLRRSLRDAGGEYKVYKNTLVRFAVRQAGLEQLEPLLEGPTAIAFVEQDVVEVARVLRDFSRTHPSLVVKGGVLGEDVLGTGEVSRLAELPSRDEMMARFAGLLSAPLQRFAALLQALPQNLAYGLKALADKRAGGEPEGPGSAAGEEAAGQAAEATAEE